VREPVTTWPRFVDQDQLFGLGLYVSEELVKVTVARANRSEIDHFSAVFFGDIGYCDRVFVDIHTDVKRARLVHG
jgi:hypothetical protein